MKKPHIPGVTADYAIVLLQNSGSDTAIDGYNTIW